jgi:hypothetical protein
MTRPNTMQLWFVAAVALIAAAVGDPCVETIASSGVFGAGYVDHNHLGVVPAAIAAAVFLSGVLVLRTFDVWRRVGGAGAPTQLTAQLESCGSPFIELARIVPLQLGVVYGMECLEALLVHRAVPGGFSWLGAPPLFSLAVQLLVSAGCLWAMRGVIRWLLAGVVAIINVAAAIRILLADAPRASRSSTIGHDSASLPRTQAPRVRQIGGRAPPAFLLAPTS